MSKKSRPLSVNRRRFVATAAAGSAALGLGLAGFPAIVRAQGKSVKSGILEPLTGPLA
mgnify:FL=1